MSIQLVHLMILNTFLCMVERHHMTIAVTILGLLPVNELLWDELQGFLGSRVQVARIAPKISSSLSDCSKGTPASRKIDLREVSGVGASCLSVQVSLHLRTSKSKRVRCRAPQIMHTSAMKFTRCCLNLVEPVEACMDHMTIKTSAAKGQIQSEEASHCIVDSS